MRELQPGHFLKVFLGWAAEMVDESDILNNGKEPVHKLEHQTPLIHQSPSVQKQSLIGENTLLKNSPIITQKGA